jgi:hypothetical protein
MTYVRNLRFDEKPDYLYLRTLFKDLFINSDGLGLKVWEQNFVVTHYILTIIGKSTLIHLNLIETILKIIIINQKSILNTVYKTLTISIYIIYGSNILNR